MGMYHITCGMLARLGFFFTGNCICNEHTATCSTLKDACARVSKIHFPKSSGQPNALGNPREGGQSLGHAPVSLSSSVLRHEANWKHLRHPIPISCPSPVQAEGCPSAQTMVEEAALAVFPLCSLRSQASTQVRARFSSWIHMKRLCADRSLPSCSASCRRSGSCTHTYQGNRKAESICSRQSRQHNAGETKSGAVFTAFLVAFSSRA